MLSHHGPKTSSVMPGIPFASTEDAWFWTVGALRARHEARRRSGPGVPRPCEPDDIVRCLDKLYRDRRIGLTHARVLRSWGERQMPPGREPAGAAERDLWREAMDRLGSVLRQKGIVT